MIDLHSHILPGLDDGVRTLEDALALARAAAAEGVEAIAATPHVREDYPTTAERMEQGVAALTAALDEAGVAIRVLSGGELDLEWLSRLEPGEVARFTLGGSGTYLLLEFPYAGWPLSLLPAIARLRSTGVTPLLAHPERNSSVQERPERLEEAIAAGALAQVTSASIEGRLGRRARAAARRLLELGLVDVIASDSHGAEVRSFGLRAAAESLGDEGLARYLTVEAPAAIVAGRPLEPARRHLRRSFSISRMMGR